MLREQFEIGGEKTVFSILWLIFAIRGANWSSEMYKVGVIVYQG